MSNLCYHINYGGENISKNKITKELEKRLKNSTKNRGIFCCPEVTIGTTSKYGRVDYLTVDSKGIWRFYEIKSSLGDFNSKSKITFLGHYNYYVMNEELYEKVKDKIPDYVGVHNGIWVIKRPKKQSLKVDIKTLYMSMIRSLYRDAEKYFLSDKERYLNSLKSTASRWERQYREEAKENHYLRRFIKSDKTIKEKFREYEEEE